MRPYYPVFSIIIPTYARPRQLACCLQSLALLSYQCDRFEVIVVDDGSEIPVESVVAAFRNQLNITLVTQPNAGPASARNRGAMEARGKFLAFTDDDCTVDPAWLQKLAARLAMTPDHMIGGRTINAIRDNPFTTTSHLMTDAVYAYYNDDPRQEHFFTTNNLALPADRFRALGGFDTSFPLAASEDREFCERWLRHGDQMTYAPEAIVHHAHMLTLRGFLKHYFKYGRGALHFHQVRAGRGLERLKMDPKFYLHLFSYPFGHVRGMRALLFEALLMLSYAAYTGGFLWEKLNGTTRSQQSGRNGSEGRAQPKCLSDRS